MKIPWRARLPWFAVWVPVALLLYTLVNGAGHAQIAYVVIGYQISSQRYSQECDFMLRAAACLYSPWGFLIVPVLLIFAYVSWKLCPQWSSSVRWMAGMLSILLCGLFLLAQAVLLHPVGWRARMPCLYELRVCAGQLWKPHLCRPILAPFDRDNPSSVWKARASDIAAFLKDRSEVARVDAAYALGCLGVKSVAPQLVEVLDDAKGAGPNAWFALGRCGGAAQAPFIVKFLEDADPTVREAAALTLGKFGDKSVVPGITKLLEDADPIVRREATLALARLGDESVVPHIVKFLKDPDPSVRRGGVQALGVLGDKSVVPEVVKLLEDDDEDVCGLAEIALGQLGEKSVIPQLAKRLEDDNPYQSSYAAIALWKLGDRSGLLKITKFLESTDPGERKSVASVLQVFSGEEWWSDKFEASARAWWEKHKDDNAWKAKP